ncbi:uncharacterized protein LOC135480607 isoform X2 [Liolophura sinensis]
MSSGDEGTPSFKEVQTARALGALFGMVAFNLVLVGIALILRRVTRPKENASNNSMELRNGKYKRKESRANVDPEKGLGAKHYEEPPEELKMAEKNTKEAVPEHHDNGGFVDVDLENETEAKSEAAYETPSKSEAANKDNPYSNLEGDNIKSSNPSDPSEDYENFQSGRQSQAKSTEAAVCY